MLSAPLALAAIFCAADERADLATSVSCTLVLNEKNRKLKVSSDV